MDERFRQAMADGYALDEPALALGAPMHEDAVAPDLRVQLALSMVNRHGLIAGATGTGKTKTLQLLAGQLSDAGVPVFVADVKGDLTGLAAPGDGANPKVVSRCESIGWTFTPKAHPVEFLSLSGALGAQVRATVSSFGPAAAGQGAGPQRDPDLGPLAHLQVLRRQRPAAARPVRSRDDAQVPRLGRGQAHPGRVRRHVAGHRRGHPAGHHHDPAGGRRRLLRRAGVRRPGPDAPDARGQGHHHRARAVRRDGQATPVLDVHALDAGPALHPPARGRRPARSRS